MYKRSLDLSSLLKQKSHFLFGPRGTGKTTLIKETLKDEKVIDLLINETYRDYLKNPSLLSERDLPKIVIIDEIQKLPELLDEVHSIIERNGTTFLLTGSSARKLKHRGVNLLAGRAWWAELYSLTSNEIDDFDLYTYLNRGGLPFVYLSNNHNEELRAYTALYLREEIQNEAFIRRVPQFSNFLELMAQSSGEEISYQSFASDCGVSPNSIKNYIEILEDTLIAFQLPAFTKTKKRKAISRSKLYFFDVGVTNSLAERGEIRDGSELFGKAFEQFIIMELRAYLSYKRKSERLSYWRSTSGFEVDVIIGNKLAVEIKATKMVSSKHLKGLNALFEEGLIKDYCIVSQDTEIRRADNITIYPWNKFLDLLWGNKLFN